MNRAIYIFLLKNSLGLYAVSFVVGWMTPFLTSDTWDDGADYYALFASPQAFGMVVLVFQNEYLNVVRGDTARALGTLPLERRCFARFLWWLAVVGPPTFCGFGVGFGLLISRREFTHTVPTILWILACQWVFAAACAAASSLYAFGKANRSLSRNKRQRFVRAGVRLAGWSSPFLVLGGGVLAAYVGSRPNAFIVVLLTLSAALIVLSYRFCERTWYPSVEARAPSARRPRFRHLRASARPALPIARWYSPLACSLMVSLTAACLAHPYWTGDTRVEVTALLGPLALGLGIASVRTTVPFDSRVLRALPVSRHGHVLILLGNPILLFVPSLIVLVSAHLVLGWNVPRSIVSFLAAFSLHCAYIAIATRFVHFWWRSVLLWFGFMGLFLFAFQTQIEPYVIAGLAAGALAALCVTYALLYHSIGQGDARYPRRIPYETYDADWI